MAAVTVGKASRLRERPLTNRLAKVLPRKPNRLGAEHPTNRLARLLPRKPRRLRRNRGLPTVATSW